MTKHVVVDVWRWRDIDQLPRESHDDILLTAARLHTNTDTPAHASDKIHRALRKTSARAESRDILWRDSAADYLCRPSFDVRQTDISHGAG